MIKYNIEPEEKSGQRAYGELDLGQCFLEFRDGILLKDVFMVVDEGVVNLRTGDVSMHLDDEKYVLCVILEVSKIHIDKGK